MPDFSCDGLRTLLKTKIGAEFYSAQIDRSIRLAFDGHNGQFREQADGAHLRIPYIVHPVGAAMVAVELLPFAQLSDTFDDVISACLTHDLLEDTSISIADLERASSARTTEIVLALTKLLASARFSRVERNKQFIQQIINAGRSAMFVKICDFLQNVSRPGQTPPALLEKAIRRGRFEYMRFFDEGHLPSELRAEYLRRLIDAERQKNTLKAVARPIRDELLTFEKALEICIKKAESKVLERHDISEVMGELINANDSLFISIDDYISSTIKPIEGIPNGTINQIKARLKAGEIDISSFKELADTDRFVTCSQVLTFNLKLGAFASKEEMLILSLSRDRTPNWVTKAALMASLALLSDRLRARSMLRVTEMADELEHIGLKVDPSLALRSNLLHEQFVSLRVRLDVAAFIHSNLEGALSHFLLREKNKFNLERIESRVKSATSILNKLDVRKSTSIESMDDIVGFRFICVSRADIGSLMQFVKDMLLDPNSDIRRMVPISADSVRVDEISSDAGYSAQHLRFSVEAPLKASFLVHCELQGRTVFQDAWARVSSIIQYKRSQRGRSKSDDLWAELSAARDVADGIVDKLR